MQVKFRDVFKGTRLQIEIRWYHLAESPFFRRAANGRISSANLGTESGAKTEIFWDKNSIFWVVRQGLRGRENC